MIYSIWPDSIQPLQKMPRKKSKLESFGNVMFFFNISTAKVCSPY